MSLMDSLLGQIGSNVDISSIASQVGIDPELAQQAVAALGAAHGQDGDTLDDASAATGLDSGTLSQIVDHLGGTGALGQLAQAMQNHPDADSLLSLATGGGSGGLAGFAGSLFGGD